MTYRIVLNCDFFSVLVETGFHLCFSVMVLNMFRSFVIFFFFFVKKMFPVFFCLLELLGYLPLGSAVFLKKKERERLLFQSLVNTGYFFSCSSHVAVGLFKVKSGSIPTGLFLAHFDWNMCGVLTESLCYVLTCKHQGGSYFILWLFNGVFPILTGPLFCVLACRKQGGSYFILWLCNSVCPRPRASGVLPICWACQLCQIIWFSWDSTHLFLLSVFTLCHHGIYCFASVSFLKVSVDVLNVVLTSAVPQTDSLIHIYTLVFHILLRDGLITGCGIYFPVNYCRTLMFYASSMS